MEKTLTAIFDGEVLRPEGPVELIPNTRYRLTVEPEAQGNGAESVWDALEKLTGVVEGHEDWAAEHDHYLYGTLKRRNEPAA